MHIRRPGGAGPRRAAASQAAHGSVHGQCCTHALRKRVIIVIMRLETIPLLLCFSGAMALAQYPGQYPPGQYPPGQYPPGRYPPGGQQCPAGQTPPCNNTNRLPGGSGKSSKNSKNSSASTGVTTTTIGMVRRAVPNQIV